MNPNNVAINIESLSNAELILMLDQPEDYLPTAVELAQQELQQRGLTQEQIDEARSYRREQESKKQQQREKITNTIQPYKSKFQKAIATFDPLITGIPPTDRAIRVVVIVFGFIAIYRIVTGYKMAWDVLWRMGQTPFFSFLTLFDFAMPILSVWLFYKRKKIGWILLVVFLTYTCTLQIAEIIEVLSLRYDVLQFIRPPSIFSLTVAFLFYAITIWALCRKNLREVFKVNNETALKSILFTSILLALSLYIAQHW